MNKKYPSIIIVFLVITILVMGCGNGRDLSKPSTRMIGHWGMFEEGESEPIIEAYVGEVNEVGFGSIYIWNGDEYIYMKYRIDSDSGDRMTIRTFDEGESEAISWNLEVAKNGQSIIANEQEYIYIDSITEP